MAFSGKLALDEVRFANGVMIVTGTKATRAAVAAEYATAPIGSQYISSVATGGTGRIYYKATESGGASGTASDWVRISSAASD